MARSPSPDAAQPRTDGDLVTRLIAATQELAAEQGIENVALRGLTAAVGKSTTAVFQHFGNKDALLLASMEDAAVRDRAFHDGLLATLSGMPHDPASLSAFVAFYILRRSTDPVARLFLEGLYKNRQFPELRALIQGWHEMRSAFWAALLPASMRDLAALLADYTTAEEAFAASLADDPAYHLLLRETTARIVAPSPPPGARSKAGEWLEATAVPLVTIDRGAITSAALRLLDQAVRVIMSRGVADLNLRRVATDAAVAPSQIVYHFGDFAAFRRQALVEALMRGLPAGLDPSRPLDAATTGDTDWSHHLDRTIRPERDAQPSGYYVDYARVLGQACLLGTRDPVLRSLALQLRALEGAGIHRLSQAEWPAHLRPGRDGATAFAIWIKGRAILNEATTGGDDAPAGPSIVSAATVLSGSPI